MKKSFARRVVRQMMPLLFVFLAARSGKDITCIFFLILMLIYVCLNEMSE